MDENLGDQTVVPAHGISFFFFEEPHGISFSIKGSGVSAPPCCAAFKTTHSDLVITNKPFLGSFGLWPLFVSL